MYGKSPISCALSADKTCRDYPRVITFFLKDAIGAEVALGCTNPAQGELMGGVIFDVILGTFMGIGLLFVISLVVS